MRYTIGEMAEIIDGDRGKNYPHQHEFLDEGYCLFLNTGNVTKAGFSFDSNQFISKEKCDLLRKGKLLFFVMKIASITKHQKQTV